MDFTILSILEIAPPFAFVQAIIDIDTDVSDDHVLTTPNIRLTGTLISDNGEFVQYIQQLAEDGVSQDNRTFTNNEVFLTFSSQVAVIFTSRYPLKTYYRYTTGNRIFIGDPLYTDQTDKAEIRYTINGKNPKISSKLYKRKMVFRENISNTEEVNLKYRVFYKGKKSNAGKTVFNLVKSKKNFYNFGQV